MYLRTLLSGVVWVSAAAAASGFTNSTANSTTVTNSTAHTNSSLAANSQATVPTELTLGVKQIPNIKNESAVDANAVATGYTLVNFTNIHRGLTALLHLKNATNIYGYDFETLNLTVTYQSDNRINVHIEPTNTTDVFILPESLVTKPKTDNGTYHFEESDLIFDYDNDDFGFEIIRASTGESLFSTKGNPLVFSNQFVQFNTSLPQGHKITGLGESIHGSLNQPGDVKTLFANDVGDPIDGNIYGVHPVYYDERANTTHGVYWRTSAIQEVLIGERSLTWRALSGVIDLYFFSGPDPKDVIKQYVGEIGLPAFQPYWALGYHQCRWGYSDVEALQDVVDTMKKFDIPMETIWSDIDYMDSYKDFTWDPYRFPLENYLKFVDTLHDNDQHYVPIFDAAIYVPNPNNATNYNYSAFHSGNDSDVFLKNSDGSLYIGAVWPGYTAFPDFLANETQDWFSEQFKIWHSNIAYDGIWTDMNEVSSFCVGSCGTGRINDNPVHPPFAVGGEVYDYPIYFNVSNSTAYSSLSASVAKTASKTSTTSSTASSTSIDSKNTLKPGKGNINYPPYAINNVQGDGDLATHAVSPNATHADGTVEYDVHNLYGFTQEIAIHKALLDINPDKRPFIIGRSTFAGAGHYVGHWGGDNSANYDMMYFSIPQAFSMGLSGIPFFGVDVCGFNGNTDEELCSRWMQLGSFFPFYRNHNVLGAISQEPYVWESVAQASRTSMNIRYLLLPYYYTLMHESHTTGIPILRAFSWEFPYQNYSGVDNQFFVGDALLVTPVLQPGVKTVNGTFPGANKTEVYYDWYTHQKQNVTDGKNETLDAPLGHIPLSIRGGNILPLQEPGYTVAASRNNSFGLLVALDNNGTANGKLYLDDGESYNVTSSLYVSFSAAKDRLVSLPYGDYNVSQPLANITVLGVSSKPDSVKFDGTKVDFDYSNSTLFVTGLDKNSTVTGAWSKPFTLSW